MGNPKGPSEGGSGGKRGHSNMEHWGYTAEVKDAARVTRRQADTRESDLGRAEAAAGQNLRRFWFPLVRTHGIGVSAYTEAEARTLAASVAAELALDFDPIEVVPDVDIQTLDQDEVVPNMGPPTFHGVWFPRLNL